MTRIWIVKRVGMDDWCILFAMVSMVPPNAYVKSLIATAWSCDWDGIGGRRDFVGLWPTRLLPDSTSISRIFEIRIRRMASGRTNSPLPNRSSKTDFYDEKTFATLTFTKLSICLFLLRITITKAFIRPLQIAIIILVISNIVISLVWLFQCTPHLDKAWDDKKPGKCFSQGQLERIIISQACQYASAGVKPQTYIPQ